MADAPTTRATLRAPVSENDHVRGNASAPVTLVEYGDFECPHCARAHPVVHEVQRRFGARLRFVFRNFPLTEIHPHAMHAAEAAEAVASLGGADAYWRMHDAIFAHAQESQHALSDRHLVQWASESGVEGAEVERALAIDAYEERVRADFMGGVRSGVNGTPTFFINGVRFDGDWSDAGTFAQLLDRAAARVRE